MWGVLGAGQNFLVMRVLCCKFIAGVHPAYQIHNRVVCDPQCPRCARPEDVLHMFLSLVDCEAGCVQVVPVLVLLLF